MVMTGEESEEQNAFYFVRDLELEKWSSAEDLDLNITGSEKDNLFLIMQIFPEKVS